jgi:hypothetical protein
MCLFLIFFWCSGFLDDLEARAFFAIDSRFGKFNSRFGRRKWSCPLGWCRSCG